jgi:uncharacterized Zn-binding protein involved in type VI secretion
MGLPAARVGDLHVCPMVTPGVPPIPHVGGPILPPGAVTVLIGGSPAAVVGNMCTCVGPPDVIIRGSLTVLIGGRPAARMGDNTAHGGVIIIGCPTVLIGDVGFSLNGLLSSLGDLLNGLMNTIADLARAVADAVAAVLQKLADIANQIANVLVAVANRVADIAAGLFEVAATLPGMTGIRRWLGLDPNYSGDGYWGTRYIGPTPKYTEMRDAKVQPVDLVDAAAFRHDQGYQDVGAAGIHGALIDPNALPADRQLAADAEQVMDAYHRGEIDPYTGQPISRRTYTEAFLVHHLFSTIATGKETAQTVGNAADAVGDAAGQVYDGGRDILSGAANRISNLF